MPARGWKMPEAIVAYLGAGAIDGPPRTVSAQRMIYA